MRQMFTVLFLFSFAFAVEPSLASGRPSAEDQLRQAAAAGDTKAVQALLSAGVSIDAKDRDGRTALLLATRANQVDAARLLIEAGADVNAKDNIQDSPYLYAGAQGRIAILKMTLDHGADLASTNRYGGTALIPAAEKGHPEAVAMLIKAGSDVDHVNNLGWTALLEAIVLSDGGPVHQKIVQQLVDAKADVNLPDSKGVTPLRHARQQGYEEIEAILLKAGAR